MTDIKLHKGQAVLWKPKLDAVFAIRATIVRVHRKHVVIEIADKRRGGVIVKRVERSLITARKGES